MPDAHERLWGAPAKQLPADAHGQSRMGHRPRCETSLAAGCRQEEGSKQAVGGGCQMASGIQAKLERPEAGQVPARAELQPSLNSSLSRGGMDGDATCAGSPLCDLRDEGNMRVDGLPPATTQTPLSQLLASALTDAAAAMPSVLLLPGAAPSSAATALSTGQPAQPTADADTSNRSSCGINASAREKEVSTELMTISLHAGIISIPSATFACDGHSAALKQARLQAPAFKHLLGPKAWWAHYRQLPCDVQFTIDGAPHPQLDAPSALLAVDQSSTFYFKSLAPGCCAVLDTRAFELAGAAVWHAVALPQVPGPGQQAPRVPITLHLRRTSPAVDAAAVAAAAAAAAAATVAAAVFPPAKRLRLSGSGSTSHDQDLGVRDGSLLGPYGLACSGQAAQQSLRHGAAWLEALQPVLPEVRPHEDPPPDMCTPHEGPRSLPLDYTSHGGSVQEWQQHLRLGTPTGDTAAGCGNIASAAKEKGEEEKTDELAAPSLQSGHISIPAATFTCDSLRAPLKYPRLPKTAFQYLLGPKAWWAGYEHLPCDVQFKINGAPQSHLAAPSALLAIYQDGPLRLSSLAPRCCTMFAMGKLVLVRPEVRHAVSLPQTPNPYLQGPRVPLTLHFSCSDPAATTVTYTEGVATDAPSGKRPQLEDSGTSESGTCGDVCTVVGQFGWGEPDVALSTLLPSNQLMRCEPSCSELPQPETLQPEEQPQPAARQPEEGPFSSMSPEALCAAFEAGDQMQREGIMSFVALSVRGILQLAGRPDQEQAQLVDCLESRMADAQWEEFLEFGYQMAVGCSASGDHGLAAGFVRDVLAPYM